MRVQVTNHAFKRLFDRSNVLHISVDYMANKAWNLGFDHEVLPDDVRSFVQARKSTFSKLQTDVMYYKVFGGLVYIFAQKTNCILLVTVINLPQEIRPSYQKFLELKGIKSKYRKGHINEKKFHQKP